jgi:hypothetical protein
MMIIKNSYYSNITPVKILALGQTLTREIHFPYLDASRASLRQINSRSIIPNGRVLRVDPPADSRARGRRREEPHRAPNRRPSAAGIVDAEIARLSAELAPQAPVHGCPYRSW